MSWAAIFSIANVVALTGWAALALLPRGPKILALTLYLGVGLLCLAYAIMLAGLIAGWFGPVPVARAAAGWAGFTSIAGIRGLFASDGGIVIGWTHYLAFDLFVGLWIAKDADHKGFPRLVQLPFLFATLMAGPIGLLLWLITREARARRIARGG